MYSPRVPYQCALGTNGERYHLCLARDELGLKLMLTLALKIKKICMAAWIHQGIEVQLSLNIYQITAICRQPVSC